MKFCISLLLFVMVLMSCGQKKIVDQYDPIDKTEEIITAINNREYEFVLKEYVAEKLFSDLERNLLNRTNDNINKQLKEYDLPSKNKIEIVEHYRTPVDSIIKNEFESDSMNVFKTESYLGENNKVIIYTSLAETKNGLKILSLGLGEYY